MEEGDSMDW